MSDDELRPVIRDRRTAHSYLIGGTVAGVGLLAVGVILARLPMWVRILFGLLGLFYLLVIGYRGSRIGVRADGQGIALVSWFRTRSIPWSEVQCFTRTQHRGWDLKRGRKEAFVVLRDGSRIGLPGTVWPRPLVDRLNQLIP